MSWAGIPILWLSEETQDFQIYQFHDIYRPHVY